MSSGDEVDLYGASYGDFSTSLYSEIRRDAFGRDIGQTGWLTADEQDLFLSWLSVGAEATLLDVACGSGGPSLRMVRETGASVLSEWFRTLAPGGRLVYTDPIVVTGALTDEEMRVRISIGFYLFVPEGLNERLLGEEGFEVERVEDRTDAMVPMAMRWLEARREREADLRAVEGEESFEGQQRFLETTAALAAERRLSRFVYYARA